MHSYIITGIRMGPFMRLLRKHGFSPSPKILARLLFIFQNCLWSSFFAWRERRLFREKPETSAVPDDPIIIIGHWRTGSTFLHQILAQDAQFIAPSVFQVTFPESFRVSYPYFKPVMRRALKHRPMDPMELGFDDPQEDEFALLKLTGESPLLEVIFPGRAAYFLQNAEKQGIPVNDPARWQSQFRLFCRKVAGNSGKKLVLKNPLHSLRIPLLLETFPNARLIHIHRHPCKVVASTLHLWKVMANDNQLKGKPYYPALEEVTAGLKTFYELIGRDAKTLPPERYQEVAFEALEQDPEGQLKRIYEAFGLEYSGEFEQRVRAYIDRTRGLKKNTYNFGDEEQAYVRQQLAGQFKHYQY